MLFFPKTNIFRQIRSVTRQTPAYSIMNDRNKWHLLTCRSDTDIREWHWPSLHTNKQPLIHEATHSRGADGFRASLMSLTHSLIIIFIKKDQLSPGSLKSLLIRRGLFPFSHHTPHSIPADSKIRYARQLLARLWGEHFSLEACLVSVFVKPIFHEWRYIKFTAQKLKHAMSQNIEDK